MSTKSVIGIIIAIIIVVLIGVWLWRAPERAQAPVTTPAAVGNSGAAQLDTDVSTGSTPVTTPTQIISTPSSSQTTSGHSKTINGMKIEVTKEGTGEPIKSGQTAVMLYSGKLTDGTVFDASSKHGNQPFEFSLGAGQVIKGWDEGIVGMKVGEERTLTIPPELGYGTSGAGNVIPPNATLIFDVTLVGIK